MYSVVIIDDNKIAVEALHKSTDWQKYGCVVNGTAFDGISGLQLIRRLSPDIVIIDIRMPGFNGLDIIKKVKSEKETMQFIIISGYAQFDYAQSALRCGVNEYLLKPVMKEDMEQALEHSVNCLDQERLAKRHLSSDELELQIYAVKSKLSDCSPMVAKAVKYVEDHLSRPITLTDICNELMVSNSHFSKCFKKETGIGFIHYVSMIKMQNARILLKNPRNRVNEVAGMLGYNDYAYFFQVFKKQFGYAPSDIKYSQKKEEQ